MTVFNQLKKALAITRKDLKIYYFRGPVVIQGLLIPAFILISFSYNRRLSFQELSPMLLAMALFFTVSAITPVIAPWETRMNTFERLVSAPIALWAIILGDVLASVIFGSAIAGAVILAIVSVLGPDILSFELILGTILAAFSFSGLGTLISAPPADKPSDIMLFATILKFGLLFISGVFRPISALGQFQFLAYFSPLTYYADLTKKTLNQTNHLDSLVNLVALAGFAGIFYVVSVKWHQHNLDKRF